MTIVDRSSEKSDHESVGCKLSAFTSGDVGMDGSCSSSWAVGPNMPSDSPRLKAQGGCLGPTPGATIFNSTPSSVDRPKEQGRSKGSYQLCASRFVLKGVGCLYIFHCVQWNRLGLDRLYSLLCLALIPHTVDICSVP